MCPQFPAQALQCVDVHVEGIRVLAGFIAPVVGHADDDASGRGQDAVKLGEECEIVIHVLQRLEGHHHVDRMIGDRCERARQEAFAKLQARHDR